MKKWLSEGNLEPFAGHYRIEHANAQAHQDVEQKRQVVEIRAAIRRLASAAHNKRKALLLLLPRLARSHITALGQAVYVWCILPTHQEFYIQTKPGERRKIQQSYKQQTGQCGHCPKGNVFPVKLF